MAWYSAEDSSNFYNVDLEGHLIAVGAFGGPIGKSAGSISWITMYSYHARPF
jgi:hypothetical protein